MRRYAIAYALVMGAGMLGMWAVFFAAGDVPEVRTEPVRLGFHLAAEGLTALLLVAAGIALWRRTAAARLLYFFALGMLAYTAIVSPGYFAQRGEWAFVAMFAVFIAAGVPAAIGAARSAPA